MLHLSDGKARFDFWCPDGMTRHDVANLGFFRAMSGEAVAERP